MFPLPICVGMWRGTSTVVTDDREPFLVARQGGKGNVVILSEEDFAGWRETVHLLSSSKNAARLLASIRQLDSGQGVPVSLLRSAQKSREGIVQVSWQGFGVHKCQCDGGSKWISRDR